ncbi:MAG: efflux RND transporter periplasmic adaptor subunit [Cytophagaceae bacterium]|jgi:RND family efflux transporter MFP subunit|nr:efflux RND transporter periplasmic adaptor subunit [Cytophagaceae bacterium]
MFSCSKETTNTNSSSTEDKVLTLSESKLKNLEINLIRPEIKALQTSLFFNGKIKALPNYSAKVSSNIDGKIDNVFVREGDYVKQGQTLITLSSMHLIELQEQYLTAKSEVDFMTIDFERQQELKRNNIGALSEYQIVEAKYKAAISKEKSIRAKLELLGINVTDLSDPLKSKISSTLYIKAPISGFIYSFPVSVGMLANPETIIAEIIDNEHLHAEIYVYDKDINLIKEGQKVQIDYVNSTFKNSIGTIISIDRVIDEITKAITVHILFESPDDHLVLPDMTIRAILEYSNNQNAGYVVPNSSLLLEEDQVYIFIADKNSGDSIQLNKIKVTLEDRNDKETEIRVNNELPKEFYVVSNNVSAIEVERKKIITE